MTYEGRQNVELTGLYASIALPGQVDKIFTLAKAAISAQLIPTPSIVDIASTKICIYGRHGRLIKAAELTEMNRPTAWAMLQHSLNAAAAAQT